MVLQPKDFNETPPQTRRAKAQTSLISPRINQLYQKSETIQKKFESNNSNKENLNENIISTKQKGINLTKDATTLRRIEKENKNTCEIATGPFLCGCHHEEDLTKKDEEIKHLKQELEKMKVSFFEFIWFLLEIKNQKNALIDTFQQIVSVLATEKERKSIDKKALHNQIKSDFKSFFDEMQNKIENIDSTPKNPAKVDLKASKFHLSSSNPFGNSRNNRTEITDNLVYSPSMLANSFEDLMESKHKYSIKPFKESSPHGFMRSSPLLEMFNSKVNH